MYSSDLISSDTLDKKKEKMREKARTRINLSNFKVQPTASFLFFASLQPD
jgi:hypothetical protein